MKGFVYLLTNIAGLRDYLHFIAHQTVLFHTTRIIEEWGLISDLIVSMLH